VKTGTYIIIIMKADTNNHINGGKQSVAYTMKERCMSKSSQRDTVHPGKNISVFASF